MNYSDRKRDEHRTGDRLLIDLGGDDVSGLVVERGDFRVECVKKGDNWFLKYPVRGRADEAVVERIVALLESAKWVDRITSEERKLRGLAFADYGLESPSSVVTVHTDDNSISLFFGDKMALGPNVYARRSRADDVYTVSGVVVSNLPSSTGALRDHFVLHGKPADTVRLEISRQGEGFIQLLRQEHGWMIQQPIVARADEMEVKVLLESIYAVKVREFFWDMPLDGGTNAVGGGALEMAGSAKVESCGLAGDAVQARITVWVDGDSLGQELLLGKTADDKGATVFAKRGKNSSIYKVNNDILDVCGVELNQLRDRRLFSPAVADAGYIELRAGESGIVLKRGSNDVWQISEPVQWPAENESVEKLLQRISLLSVVDYPRDIKVADCGFAQPRFRIVVRKSEPPAEKDATDNEHGVVELEIGNRYADNRYFARLAGSDEVLAVDAVFVNQLLAASELSPLHYRNRVLLSVKPDHVQRIRLVKHADDSSVELNKEGQWVCPASEDVVPSMRSISNLLAAVSRVRVSRIVAQSPKDLTQYGLADPLAVVTIGLSGDSNIQKTLLIGKAGESPAYYAMVRGQDLVFPVDAGWVSDVTRQLCVPVSTNSVPVEEESK